jgi:sec-independent protein translocase protein TatB
MFGLNWGEVIVIGIVALIAIGPKELPTVLRTLGQWMGKVRRMANDFQSQFNEALREAEFADLKKHADDISSSVSEIGQIDPLADVQKDVEREFAAVDPAAEVHASATPAVDAENPASAALLDSAPPPQVESSPPEPPVSVTAEDFTPAAPPPAQKAGSGA